jgi:hypothetical protein
MSNGFRWITPGRWHHIGLTADEKRRLNAGRARSTYDLRTKYGRQAPLVVNAGQRMRDQRSPDNTGCSWVANGDQLLGLGFRRLRAAAAPRPAATVGTSSGARTRLRLYQHKPTAGSVGVRRVPLTAPGLAAAVLPPLPLKPTRTVTTLESKSTSDHYNPSARATAQRAGRCLRCSPSGEPVSGQPVSLFICKQRHGHI